MNLHSKLHCCSLDDKDVLWYCPTHEHDLLVYLLAGACLIPAASMVVFICFAGAVTIALSKVAYPMPWLLLTQSIAYRQWVYCRASSVTLISQMLLCVCNLDLLAVYFIFLCPLQMDLAIQKIQVIYVQLLYRWRTCKGRGSKHHSDAEYIYSAYIYAHSRSAEGWRRWILAEQQADSETSITRSTPSRK